MPKYYLLAGDTSQVYIFSLHKIKMSKQALKLALTYKVKLTISKMFTVLPLSTLLVWE